MATRNTTYTKMDDRIITDSLAKGVNIVNSDCLPVLKWLPEQSVAVVVTSPPYNMRTRIRNGEYTTRERSDHFSKKYTFFSDDLPIDVFYKTHSDILGQLLRVSKLVFYNIQIVTGSKEAFFQIIGDFRKQLKDIIIWDKGFGQPAMHSGVINRQTEMVLIFQADAVAGREITPSYFERGTVPDLWRLPRGQNIKGHGATFPCELVTRILTNWSKEGDIILDPFMGTGTTGVVAAQMNRKFVGIEIAKEYYDTAKDHIKNSLSYF